MKKTIPRMLDKCLPIDPPELSPFRDERWKDMPASRVLARVRRSDVARLAQGRELEPERVPIFDVEFVYRVGAEVVAQLLNDCFYDLVDAEKKRP